MGERGTKKACCGFGVVDAARNQQARKSCGSLGIKIGMNQRVRTETLGQSLYLLGISGSGYPPHTRDQAQADVQEHLHLHKCAQRISFLRPDPDRR